MRELLNKVVQGHALDTAETEDLMGRMMDEELTPIQIAAFLIALRAKGETADEVVGFARAMRSRARPIELAYPVADTCGTGGDGRGTFNISTAAALVLAAAGQPVAKHGNRAASGRCGSADVLEALGVDVALPPEGVARCIQEAGIGFLFAPAFHPAMKFAAQPRRELGIRTVFNLLGPLTNPARPRYQLLGVSSAELLDLMAESLAKLGVEHALIVHSEDGTDEISIAGPTDVREIRGAEVRSLQVTPEELGLERAPADSMQGGDADTNAGILMGVLQGQEGPARDAVIMNAAAALYAANRAPNLADGARIARDVLDARAALATLTRLREASQGARKSIESAA